MPIDYARANAMIRRQRAALTCAVNSRDPAKVILAAQKAVGRMEPAGDGVARRLVPLAARS